MDNALRYFDPVQCQSGMYTLYVLGGNHITQARKQLIVSDPEDAAKYRMAEALVFVGLNSEEIMMVLSCCFRAPLSCH